MTYDVTWRDTIRYDMIRYDTIRYDIMIWYNMIWYDMIYFLISIWLSPGDSSTVHIYTRTMHRTTKITTEHYKLQIIERVRAVPCLTVPCRAVPCPTYASFTLPFALQLRINTEKSQDMKNLSESTAHITKTPTHYKIWTHIHTHTHSHTHTHTHTHTRARARPHNTKQYKTTTVQIKTNTAQDIPKWNSHNIINARSIKSP
jgi:hypothetical protein